MSLLRLGTLGIANQHDDGGLTVVFGLLTLRKWLPVACVAVFLAAGSGLGLAQPAATAGDSVFQLVTMSQTEGRYASIAMGTAFFIDADGIAITNSHVVYRAQHNAGRYRLAAIVGKEFYGATVVCASALAHDPGDSAAGVELGRDVAEVKLTASQFPFTKLTYQDTVIATAHLGALARFPALVVRGDPVLDEAVRVIGFGQDRLHPNLQRKWAVSGSVMELGVAHDGTPLAKIAFLTPPDAGASGSPVLDAENRVVGLYSWRRSESSAFGIAMGGSALLDPCAGR